MKKIPVRVISVRLQKSERFIKPKISKNQALENIWNKNDKPSFDIQFLGVYTCRHSFCDIDV